MGKYSKLFKPFAEQENMTADEALAVVLENGGAGATRANIQRMIDRNKDVKVYELSVNGDKWISQ